MGILAPVTASADRGVVEADLRRMEVGAVPDPVGRLGLLVEL